MHKPNGEKADQKMSSPEEKNVREILALAPVGLVADLESGSRYAKASLK